ncbi:MAG: hypothetical protein ABJQ34_20975 [Paracoccaceae bacterium]
MVRFLGVLCINTAITRAMVPILAVAAVIVSSLSAVSHPNHGSHIESKYEECQKVLWSYPANTLSEMVPRGFGSRLASGKLRLHDILPGLHCSDDQIIDYMTHHGLPYRDLGAQKDSATDEPATVVKGSRGDYNRALSFCIPRTSFLRRLIQGECGGITSFMMLDDKVSYIESYGFK